MKKKKGQAMITLVFLGFLGILIIFAWINYGSLLGPSSQQRAINNLNLQSIENSFMQNYIYFRTALSQKGTKASYKSAAIGGNNYTKNDEVRYWQCGQTPNPPSLKKTKLYVGRLTRKKLNRDITPFIERQNRDIKNVEPFTCVKTEPYNPIDDPSKDRYRIFGSIEELKIAKSGTEIKREDFNIKGTVLNLRYWYMYNVLKEWTNNNLIKNKIHDKVTDIPDKSIIIMNRACIPESLAKIPDKDKLGKYCITPVIRNSWRLKLETAIRHGVKTAVQDLRTDSKYFGGKNIDCSYKIETGPTGQKVLGKAIPSVESRSMKIFKKKCNKTYHLAKCNQTFSYNYASEVQLKVTCKDKSKSKAPALNKPQNLTWNIKLTVIDRDEIVKGKNYIKTTNYINFGNNTGMFDPFGYASFLKSSPGVVINKDKCEETYSPSSCTLPY